MSKKIPVLAVLAVTLGNGALAAAELAEQKTLTLDGARVVMAAARAAAPVGGSIAIVDAGGALLLFERVGDTFTAGPEVSIGKARTAARFKRPTKVFEELINGGRTAMVTLDGFTPLQGGVPVEVEGQMVGAIGVSGAASAAQDSEIAMAGAAAASSLHGGTAMAEPSAGGEVAFLPAAQVSAAFAKGTPLLEVDGYKVHASRRDGPGMAEVHARDTDIVYVLAGTATVVTGGSVVDGKTTAPDELRGSGIRGGRSQRLAKGDVMVIPHGTPHWFEKVTPPFTYYVVKVTAGSAR